MGHLECTSDFDGVRLFMNPILIGCVIIMIHFDYGSVFFDSSIVMSQALGRPPPLSAKAVCKLACKHFNFKNATENSVKSFPSYDDRNYYLCGEPWNTEGSEYEFVLKLNNPNQTSFQVVKGINDIVLQLKSCGFKFSLPCPVFNSAGLSILELSAAELAKTSLSGESTSSQDMANGSAVDDPSMRYPVSVLSFIPGDMFDSIGKKYLTPALLYEAGVTLATIDKEFKNCSSATVESRVNTYWDIFHFLNVEPFISEVNDDPSKKAIAEIVFKSFKEYLVPKIPSLNKSIIHGDFNGLNIVLTKKLDLYDIAGVIDFGDCMKSCTIFDLGISLFYLMVENMDPVHCSSPVEFSGPAIQGYHSILPLSVDEFDCLYHIVLTRSVQSALLGMNSFRSEPWNKYLLTTIDKGWAIADMLLSTSKEEVDRIWKTFL